MITATREQRRQLARENAKLPKNLTPVDVNISINAKRPPIKAWRNREFLVQAYAELLCDGVSVIRLSVNRAALGDNGRWLENITWEELMELKRQAGFGDFYAIEVYPKDKDIVNVANMRHLWVLREPLNIGWVK